MAAKSDERSLPGKTSKEADRKQLRVAREQGDKYKKSLSAISEETGRSKTIKVRDYLVSYAEEDAEGLYQWEEDQLVWHNPEEENAHLEIAVEDAEDGRFLPYLQVHATIFESGKDQPILSVDLPFLWHPWLYHYGANIKLPKSGNYDLLVNVSEMRLPRHDKENGKRHDKPVEVRFENVPMTTGQKKN